MFEKSLPYYFGDTPYARRTLIGGEEQLKTFKYASGDLIVARVQEDGTYKPIGKPILVFFLLNFFFNLFKVSGS